MQKEFSSEQEYRQNIQGDERSKRKVIARLHTKPGRS